MPAWDLLKAAWILIVFLMAFFWVPSRLFPRGADSAFVMRIAGNFVRMVLCVSAAVFLLTSIKALTAITVVLLFVAAVAAAWLRKYNWSIRAVISSLQTRAVRLMRKAESRSFGMSLNPLSDKSKNISIKVPWRLRANYWFGVLEGREALIACFVVILILTAALAFEHPIREMRFEQAEQYSSLLRSRELLLNLHPAGLPFVFPAIATATSLISGTDPLEVTRFLYPVIGLLLVLATGLLVRTCTRTGVAGIAAMYCLGAAAFPLTTESTQVAKTTWEKILSLLNYSPALTRPSAGFMIGLVFLLLGLSFLAHWQRTAKWDVLVDLGCCVVLVAVASHYLLVVLVTTAVAVLITPLAGLITLVVACYGVAGYATLVSGAGLPNDIYVILPLTAAVGVALIVALANRLLAAAIGKEADTVVLVGFVVLAIFLLRPHELGAQYLEYESSARETRDITTRFPRQRWLMVAPVEQLPQTFGFGGYEDLANFVRKYEAQVSNPDFQFPDAPDDLFIYVEKNPFQLYTREPSVVSFPVLTDVTYRNYRSPAGRASLETAALRFCESYRSSHSNLKVFFEDADLRIYQIHQEAEKDRTANR